MAEGKQRDQWLHTSSILSQLHSCHFTQFRPPSFFDPFTRIDKPRKPRTFDFEGLKMRIPAYAAAQAKKLVGQPAQANADKLIGGGSTPAAPPQGLKA